MKKRISEIPEKDRPREKLRQKGAEALSDPELMAILLGRGTKKHDVLSVANKILNVLERNKGIASLDELQKIEGVGLAKATLGIKLLDHIIFNHKEYYSFLEHGEMFKNNG